VGKTKYVTIKEHLTTNLRLVHLQGGGNLSYHVRLMRQEDVSQIAVIDRDDFPTILPQTNYQREFKNPLAHYVVACDNEKAVDEVEMTWKETEQSTGLISRLIFRNKVAPPSDRQYITGFAGFWIIAGETHIINFAVRRSYRRKGIGELLFISLIDLAKELKSLLITLEVRASNSAARNLYRKYGFHKTGLRRGYYSDDKEDGVIMTVENIGSVSFQKHLNHLKQAHSQKWGTAIYRISR
jgi:ribosomal-protein-alanine N-acetyltransferase